MLPIHVVCIIYDQNQARGRGFDISRVHARDITSLCPVSLAYPENLHAVVVARAAGRRVLPGVLSAVLAAIAAELLSDQRA